MISILVLGARRVSVPASLVAWIFAQVFFRKTLTRVESISPESFKCSKIANVQNWPRGDL